MNYGARQFLVPKTKLQILLRPTIFALKPKINCRFKPRLANKSSELFVFMALKRHLTLVMVENGAIRMPPLAGPC